MIMIKNKNGNKSTFVALVLPHPDRGAGSQLVGIAGGFWHLSSKSGDSQKTWSCHKGRP